jgi:hypothetical protein
VSYIFPDLQCPPSFQSFSAHPPFSSAHSTILLLLQHPPSFHCSSVLHPSSAVMPNPCPVLQCLRCPPYVDSCGFHPTRLRFTRCPPYVQCCGRHSTSNPVVPSYVSLAISIRLLVLQCPIRALFGGGCPTSSPAVFNPRPVLRFLPSVLR